MRRIHGGASAAERAHGRPNRYFATAAAFALSRSAPSAGIIVGTTHLTKNLPARASRTMRTQPTDEMIDAIYAAPMQGGGWGNAMRLLREHYGSNMEALYFLDFAERRTNVVELQGVAPGWLRQFSQLYFLPDNPWARYTAQLHRPGMVRTAERLARLTGDPDILRRSTYFNEWMRPQCFAHTIGVTPYAQHGMVANLSLFRPSEMPPFDDDDVASMHALAPHFQRALAFCMRLDRSAQSERLGLAVLDTLPEGYALIDGNGTLRHANPALERWLHEGTVLESRAGRLQARLPSARQALAALVRQTAHGSASGHDRRTLHGTNGDALEVRAMPVPGGTLGYAPLRTYALLMFSERPREPGDEPKRIAARYRLTRAESRLALQLADGCSLREAAARCGIGYGTARGYLKLVFQKTGTHRQSELVALLLGRGHC